MTDQSGNVWYYLIGAGFIGFWLYIATIGEAEPGWVMWGIFGIAIAAAFYAGRLADENVRIGIWIVTGLFGGFLVAAAVLEPDPMFTATFITGVGAGLIAAGLPGGRPSAPPRAQAPPTQPHSAAGATERPDPTTVRYGPPGPEQQQVWGPGSQQQQQWSQGPEYR